MKIMQPERNISPIMSLDEGDIFKLDDSYFIAGDRNYIDCIRVCFNINTNNVAKIHHNPVVEYWHSANVKLLLSEE